MRIRVHVIVTVVAFFVIASGAPSGGSRAMWLKRAHEYLRRYRIQIQNCKLQSFNHDFSARNSRAPPHLIPIEKDKGDPVLDQFSLKELYHMLELLDRIEADRSVDLTTNESKTFKYLLDAYVGRK